MRLLIEIAGTLAFEGALLFVATWWWVTVFRWTIGFDSDALSAAAFMALTIPLVCAAALLGFFGPIWYFGGL